MQMSSQRSDRYHRWRNTITGFVVAATLAVGLLASGAKADQNLEKNSDSATITTADTRATAPTWTDEVLIVNGEITPTWSFTSDVLEVVVFTDEVPGEETHFLYRGAHLRRVDFRRTPASFSGAGLGLVDRISGKLDFGQVRLVIAEENHLYSFDVDTPAVVLTV